MDSRRDLADSVNALLAEIGRAPLSEALIGTMVGDGAAQLVERALAAAGGDPPPADALARFLGHYDRRLTVHTKPYGGTEEMLAALHARRLKLGVLTNKPQDAAGRVLRGLGLMAWFDAGVIGADGAHPRKPDPAGLRAMAAAAGVPLEQTVLVGDGAQDVETARRAGARVCAARYGYGFAAAEPLLVGADWVIDAPEDLLLILPG